MTNNINIGITSLAEFKETLEAVRPQQYVGTAQSRIANSQSFDSMRLRLFATALAGLLTGVISF